MKDRRVERERTRSERGSVSRERGDRLVEEKRPVGGRLECCFEIAHLTWVRRVGAGEEPVNLGQASEPMS